MAVLTLEDCSANRSPSRLVRRIDKVITMHIESRFPMQELSFMHWIALKVVRDGTAGNAGELARELGITTGATTRMIDALEGRGLLERDRGAADRRVVRLVLTEAGRAKIAELQHSVVEAWNDVLADFEQHEVDRMIADLTRVLDAAERVVASDAVANDRVAEAAE